MALTDDVIATIKAMILRGDLRAGEQLPVEAELADALGVSRGSLREGVRSLISMGVLESRQGAGTYVTNLDLRRLLAPMEFVTDLDNHDPLQFHHVRRVLECEAAALAAGRSDWAALDRAEAWLLEAERMIAAGEPTDLEALMRCDVGFHDAIADAGGNAVLAALLEVLAGRTWRSRSMRSEVQQGAVSRGLEDHRSILEAVRAQDSDRARVLMHVHLLGVEDFITQHRHNLSDATHPTERTT